MTDSNAPGPALMTVQEAARVLRLSRSKVYQIVARGDLPSVRIDGSRRVKARDLERYIDQLGNAA